VMRFIASRFLRSLRSYIWLKNHDYVRLTPRRRTPRAAPP
jgi:hypothetical protein